jgi:hypothetical protein
VLAVRRTPVYDPFADHDDPNHEPAPNNRRINTTPGADRIVRRAEVRPIRTTRRAPPRSGPDPRVWFIRGSIGVAALAGLWLGLQALFPVSESHVSQAPTPAPVVDANAVGAPEPPAVQPAASQPAASQPAASQPAASQPAASQPAASQPAPTAAPQVAPAQEGDRLPGLPTPDPAAVAQVRAPAAPSQPAAAAAQPQPTPIPAPTQAAAEPAASQPAPSQPPAEQAPPAEAAQPQPTPIPAPAQADPAQPAAEDKPRVETPAQQPAGPPTAEPIPPPPSAQAGAPRPAAPPVQQAPPAPKPQAPAPAAPPPASSGGAFALSASASPVNPISEQAVVTVTVRATQGGAPLAGASCMASIHYRTATVKQPEGGFRTNAGGVGSFTLDARGTTYGYYIPIDVTCSGRGGTATARTGFTPVKGR